MSNDNLPLPDGWIREVDPKTKHPFWVDTRAKPPRSIWIHPYEDEQFLREHPDIRDRLAREREEAPPPYSPRRHSYSGAPSGSRLNVPERTDAARPTSHPGTPVATQNDRGFFGKLKDKAVGTKEEREARRREDRRREEEYMRQLAEQRRLRQQALEQQRMSSPFGRLGGSSSYGSQYGRPFGQPMYAAPAGNPFSMGMGRRPGMFGGGYGGGYGGGMGMGGMGGMGMGLPILGGLAGGLILGDMLDGPGYGGGYGGGFDGGGFDGGGFDGGGFDGGGF
ncbi:hypothetical protein OH76DRAFT_1470727 [Lentinus brumalis]|uniref:WW domain-containing protein n=1 Tax=Lentinus brumalis TaxID=2498619 RepID=A0A371DHP5_9APHY|nr:hypothetical protein OH76DRAFT_1470727 [Polyporus brumalis]